MLRQRHPPGLYVLFFTEMWERFGFYCMLAIFVLYMTESGHPLLREHASQIYGLYLGFVYFTPFFGGLLADRAWGYGRTILAGAVVLGLGYFLLAVDHLGFFFAGLLALVLGNGLFKPNISVLVGKLYRPGDPRLDNAFTIFYMGINVGAFTSPLVAQYLRKEYGYQTAFAAAGVGMALSLAIFLVCRRWLRYAEQGPPPPEAGPPQAAGSPPAVGAVDTRVEPAAPVGVRPAAAVGAPATAPAVGQLAAEFDVPPAVQRRRHVALLIIFVIVALFWMGFKQNGNTFALWARDCTDRHPSEGMLSALQTLHLDRLMLDKEGAFAPELFASVNPFFVVAFSPLLVAFWAFLKGRGWEPSTPAKVGLGMVLAAGAFVLLVVAGRMGGDTGARVSAWYLLGGYAIITVGELCLSPMGLSLVSKLAAPKQRSTWMGGWFAATAIGGYLSGLVGGWWKEWPHSTFFGFLAGTSLFAAALLLLSYRYLQSAMPPVKR